ncbi:MAG: alpha/beta fold hydrolase [Myxococcales bacterium]
MDCRKPRLVGTSLVLVLCAGCAAHNLFGREIHVERGSYLWRGERLDYYVGVAAGTRDGAPLAVFVEGDGSQCQGFREEAWRRFLVRRTGSALLVRPRTYVNTVCGTPRFAQADFLHRVEELGSLLQALRAAYPGRAVFLIGHSAGAHVAVLHASAHPGEVAGIANLGGGTWPLSDLLPEIAREKGRRGLLEPAAVEARLADHQSLMARLRAAPDSESPMWARTERFWSQMFFSGVRPLWSSAEFPVLVLHGTQDLDSVPASAVAQSRDEMARAGKANVQFVLLQGLGHDLLGERPFQLVDQWISSQSASRPRGAGEGAK